MDRQQAGLATLETDLARDLQRLTLPAAAWPAERHGPDGAPMPDVLVIGAGMYGVAAAAALTFKGIRNIQVLDRAPEGLEGPWVTTARMRTLRSPKHLPGIDLGIPSLTFRAWFEAAHGAEAWDPLYKILNAEWQDYITWVRRALRLPVANGVEVLAVHPSADHVGVTLRDAYGTRRVATRRLVMASGRAGTGGPSLPPGVDPALFPKLAAHSNDVIDFAALRAKRVAVIGAGPSSWDNAAAALEAGAARVDLYIRRRVLPQVNKGRGSANQGFFEGWPSLPAAEKWRLLAYMHDVQSPPPHESILRVLDQPGFHVHLGTPLRGAVAGQGGGVALTVGDGQAASADFLIFGTGFSIDMARIAEFASFAGDIALWADRYTPPPGLQRAEIARFPWLDAGFELTARDPAATPGLSRIHLFNHAAMASLGAIASDVPGVSIGAGRLARQIAAAIFAEDIDVMRARLEAFDEPELKGTPFFAL
ncbi:hypothetical protein BKE38_04930 [Pseudoroseomonas deserti]|uniref:FAD-dependent oxidoreductase n=1 Tax=Teichococcus deserti TaxID=1817963 RepID=A0A1V2H8G5_9PROT|nr:NAD(P)/FAD-dependent oxidoreductase [Pseudoroseomonas deserti]ONG57044.1 hypothetical protein BKE38_04930 [Pseudoroseomonas deserti]